MRESGFRTKQEAVEAYEREKADRRSGRHVTPSRLTLGEYLETRWLPAVEASVRPSTFAYHRSRVERTIVPALGHIALQELGADDRERFYAQLLKGGRIQGEGGLSPQSIRHIHVTIRRASTTRCAGCWSSTTRRSAFRCPRRPSPR